MAKTNVDILSASNLVLEAQVGGTTPAAPTVSAATASTHKIAITISGVTYYILLTNV